MYRHRGLCLVAVAAVAALLTIGSTANARHHSGGSGGGFFGGSHGGNASHGGRGSHGGFGGLFHRSSSQGCGSTGGHGGASYDCGCSNSAEYEDSDDEKSTADHDDNARVMDAPREGHGDANDGSADVQEQKSSHRDEAQLSGAAPVESQNDNAQRVGDEKKVQNDANDKNKEQTQGTKEERNNPTPGSDGQSK